MIKITDGNAFILRVQGITRNGDYEAEVDLSQIDSMTANFVRRGRSTQESSFDSSGRLLISNEGTLDKGVYGVEMVGYYNGQPWRSYAKNVFEIVNANVDADDSDATMNDVPIYDVTIAVTLGGSGVTADFVDAMIAKHSDDETSHPYLIEKIENAGKVDDVLVNGVSVVDEDKVADIPVPTTVAELSDANNYATKNYVDAQMATAGHVDDVKVNGQSVVANKEANINIPTTVAELEDAEDYATNEGVEEALAAKQETITEASVEYTEDGGSPDASVEFENGTMTFQMKNMKMKFSELTAADKEELKGAKGDPGDSAVYNPDDPDAPDFVMANTTGQSTTKAMTQKAVTDAIEQVRVNGWYSLSYSIVSNIALAGASFVGEQGTYESKASAYNYKVMYVGVNAGDIIHVVFNNIAGFISADISSNPPSVGVTATRLFYKNYNSEDTTLDVLLTMPTTGYLCVQAIVSNNTYVPTIYKAAIINDVASLASDTMLVRRPIALGENQSYIITSLGILTNNVGNSRGVWVDVSPGRMYAIRSNLNAAAAILKNNSTTLGAAAFADTFPSRVTIDAGSEYVFQAPSDAHYVYLLTVNSTGIDTGISLSEADYVNNVAGNEHVKVPLNVDLIKETVGKIISSSNKWANTIGAGGSKLIHVKSGCTYIIESELTMPYALLQDDVLVFNSSPHFSSSYPGRIVLPPSSPKRIVIPSDTNYLYVASTTTSGETHPKLYEVAPIDDAMTNASNNEEKGKHVRKRIGESLGNTLTPLSFVLDDDGVEMPSKKEILAVIRKSRQITDIEWTPLAQIPHNHGNGYFAANTPVTGLPYSSVKEIDKYIGFDVTIHTFMTAVNNPYSLLYTENLRADRSKSVWGRTYHGTNCGSYMGVACSVLTGYSTGQDKQWTTAEDRWCAEVNMNMIRVYDQSAQGLQIGDIYWMEGHNRLIIGLKRDSIGNVTHVLISEAAVIKAQENNWVTAESFDNTLSAENGIIYRNIELYKNCYSPSAFVAVGDEVAAEFDYNDDICTFAGDKASFREGEQVVLNYNLKSENDWQAIEIYKDGSLYDTIELSSIYQPDLPESQRYHACNLGTSLVCGQYKARMVGSAGSSDWTYWEVIEANVTVTRTGLDYTIKWQSANGTPITVSVCDIEGNLKASFVLDRTDIQQGRVIVDLERLAIEQHNTILSPNSNYLKVHFCGNYGRVTNNPILLAQ